MCGIVAIIAKGNKLPIFADDVFSDMLRMDTIRGEDSTGCFGVTSKGIVDILKGDTDGYRFVDSTPYAKFKKRINGHYSIVVGHNRKATKGNVSPHNAHPFKNEHIYLVHNGIMRNADDIDKTVEVDSMAIAKALATHDALGGLNKIDGAYSLVWFNQKDQTLSLARNSERPLFLVEYDTCWLVSSEAGLPVWLMSREARKHLSVKYLEPEKLLCFNLKDLAKGYEEIKYEEYVNWMPLKPVVHAPLVQVESKSYPPNPDYSGQTSTLKRKMKELGLTVGDSVLVRIDDYEVHNGANILLGHPIINKTVDETIIIRAACTMGVGTHDILDKATKGQLFTAKVQQWRGHQGIPLLFVRDLQPYELLMDVGDKPVVKTEIESVLKVQGCGRCNGPISIADISQSIVRKKLDGSNKWRLLCKTCFNESIELAQRTETGVSQVAH